MILRILKKIFGISKTNKAIDPIIRKRLESCLSEVDYHIMHKGEWEFVGNGCVRYSFDYQRTEEYKKMNTEERKAEDRKNGNYIPDSFYPK